MKFFVKERDKNKPQVLFETSHYCVVYKPSGYVVPIEEKQKNNLERWVKEHFLKKLNKETVFLRPIHRIDKVVSGLVVFARSSKGLSRLQRAQREGLYKKYYLATVEGVLKKRDQKLRNRLIHGDYRAIISSDGKESFLRYRVLNLFKSKSQIGIYLLTGRYHQIRAQLSHIKHPIVGDKKYGSKCATGENGIELSHAKIIFPDPITKLMRTYSLRLHN